MDESIPKCSQPWQRQNATRSVPSLTPAGQAMTEGLDALGRSKRLRTMWPRMQRLCPPRSERLWVIGGQPGNYKTQLVWNLAMDMASLKQRVLFVSLEQTPGETVLQAVARYSGIPLDAMERAQMPGGGGLTAEQEAGLEVASRKIAETELFLRMHGADSHGRSIDDVIRSATRTHFDAIFLDHIGMVGRDEGRELEQLGNAVDRLRALTRGEVVKGYGPFICVTTPLKRDAKAGEDDEIPSLTDFRGTSRLEYDSDFAMILKKRKREEGEREDEPDLVDGFVVKNRKGRCPIVLQFEAQGDVCTVRERAQDFDPAQHWTGDR